MDSLPDLSDNSTGYKDMDKKKRTRKPHTEETKQRMSILKKKLYASTKHPSEKRQYIYATDYMESEILTSTEIKAKYGITPSSYLPKGIRAFTWRQGKRKNHKLFRVKAI
jgi:hypothetical protein